MDMPEKMQNVITIVKSIMKSDKNVTAYVNDTYRLRPLYAAGRIALIYGIMGVLWIVFSSRILYFFVADSDKIRDYEIYKGWIFIVLTTALVYWLVLKNMLLFEEALCRLKHNFQELNMAHRNLLDMEESLHRLASTDYLTGLPNKRAFEQEISNMADGRHGKREALIYMDIDNFKNINDTLGHNVGDRLLVEISQGLRDIVNKPDRVFRISGDEFAIILADAGPQSSIDERMEGILKHIRKPWKILEHEFYITYSIGITIFPDDGRSMNVLLRNVDTAMYSVKKGTKDNCAYYSKELMMENVKKVEMANELRKAIRNQELTLFYQPIMHLERNRIEGAEVLVRWEHPEKGFISPGEFIPLAEETGLIYDIDRWVLRTAMKQKRKWEEDDLGYMKISVNLSGSSLIKERLAEEITELVEEYGIDTGWFQIEVTETALMENIRISAQVLEEIRMTGIKIALDDFGTGYSSLTYLKSLPIDVVKLDRQFVWDMLSVEQADLIVKSVIQLTHDLLFEIIAEGIEKEDQLLFLRTNKCDYGQGYLFSRPLPKDDFEKLCREQQ